MNGFFLLSHEISSEPIDTLEVSIGVLAYQLSQLHFREISYSLWMRGLRALLQDWLYRPQEASLLWKLPEGKKGKGQEAEPNGRLASMCRCCNLTGREECEVGFF